MTWVHDRVYAAGGEQLPRNWASFVDQTGITAILHLQPNSPATFVGPTPVCFLWMDLEGEAQAGLEERWLAATFIERNLQENNSVLLHSGLRRHRVRWVYVAYLIMSGKSVQATLNEVEQKPWLSPYHTDRKDWEDFKEFTKVSRGA